MRVVSIVLLVSVAGCEPGSTTVLVSVDAPGKEIRSLSVRAAIGDLDGGVDHLVGDGGAVGLPGTLVFRTPDLELLVSASVTGIDAGGQRLAANGQVRTIPHRRVTLPLTLGGEKRWSLEDSHTNSDLFAVWGSGARVWAVGRGGTVVRRAPDGDAGQGWTPQASGITGDLHGVWGVTENDVVAVGALPNNAIATHDAGATWRFVDVAHVVDMEGIWGSGRGDLTAVGDNGDISQSTDGGNSWMDSPTQAGVRLYAVWGSSSSNLVAVGVAGTILRQGSADGGAVRWQSQTVAGADLRGIWGTGSGDVFVVGAGGTILHSSDGAASWASQNSGTVLDLRAIWGGGPSDVYAVGAAGMILHSVDGGQSWITVPSGTANSLYAIWSDGADVYVVGANGVIVHGW